MWTLLLFVACKSAPTPTDTDPSDTDTVDDAAIVAALLDGTGTASEVLGQVAWSGGWPVQSEAGYVFLIDGPGPWSLVGDFNDWVAAPMDCSAGYCAIEVAIAGDPAGMKYKFTDTLIGGVEALYHEADDFGGVAGNDLDAATITARISYQF